MQKKLHQKIEILTYRIYMLFRCNYVEGQLLHVGIFLRYVLKIFISVKRFIKMREYLIKLQIVSETEFSKKVNLII